MFLPDASNRCLPVPTVLDVIKGPSSLPLFTNPLGRYHSGFTDENTGTQGSYSQQAARAETVCGNFFIFNVDNILRNFKKL